LSRTPQANTVFSALRWSAAGRLVAQLTTWTATIFVARTLTPDDYGLFALSALLTSYVAMLTDYGLGAAVVRAKILDEHEVSSIDTSLVVLALAIMICLMIAAPSIATIFGDQRVSTVVRALSLTTLMAALNAIPTAVLARQMRFDSLARVTIASNGIAAVISLTCAYSGLGVWALVAGVTVELAVRAAFLRTRCKMWSLRVPQFSHVKRHLGFSKWVVGERTLWYWYAEADTAIVGRMLGSDALGVFSMAKQLGMAPIDKVVPILNQIALPTFSAIQSDASLVLNQSRKVLRLGSAYAFPALWGLAAIAPSLVTVLLGPRWRGAGDIMAILCVALPFRFLTAILAPALTAFGRPDITFRNTVGGLVLLPVTLLVGVNWGTAGVAIAWAVTVPVISMLFLRKTADAFSTSLGALLACIRTAALAGLVMATSVSVLMHALVDRIPLEGALLICIFIGAALYIGVLYLIDRPRFFEALDFVRSAARL